MNLKKLNYWIPRTWENGSCRKDPILFLTIWIRNYFSMGSFGSERIKKVFKTIKIIDGLNVVINYRSLFTSTINYKMFIFFMSDLYSDLNKVWTVRSKSEQTRILERGKSGMWIHNPHADQGSKNWPPINFLKLKVYIENPKLPVCVLRDFLEH